MIAFIIFVLGIAGTSFTVRLQRRFFYGRLVVWYDVENF
jgi:hypothetical protein